ncbi:MAG TPA: HAMP domain-containing sensor histidine kinase [Polyangia bacterium]|jgi:signal transduction histidine kinase|nr:HAMP domain-containing sensor histidine kinase [Polyangia bacterium]
MGEGDRRPTDGARERQRVLLVCAAVIVVSAMTDRWTLGYFTWRPLVVRLLWATFVVATAFNMRGAGRARTRELMLALAVFSTAFYAALAALTGGVTSQLFHWMLALPVAIAVVIQDHPAAIIGSGLTMLAGGLGILTAAGTTPALCWQWAGTATIMVLLAAYISGTYGRLHAREAALRRAGAEADTRARASEAAIVARDEFLAIAAHELRTPLTSLLLQIDAVERTVSLTPGGVLGEVERQRIGAIARQASRLSGLIDGMLDMSRLTAGRLELNFDQVDLAALAREVAQRFAPDAAAASCAVKIDLGEALVGLWDESRLDQIITNLIANAVKYGAGGGIEVEGRGDAEVVQLIVRDHGIGISAEDQQRIFRRFERASGQRQHPGLGLGLWITSELCKALGGKISVTSAVGAGAAFTVTLPRRSPTALESQKPRLPEIDPPRA